MNEHEIIMGIYNYTFDNQHIWNIADIEIIKNLNDREILKITDVAGKSLYIKIEEEL